MSAPANADPTTVDYVEVGVGRQGAGHSIQMIGFNPVVRIQKGDPFMTRSGYAPVASGAQAPPRSSHEANAGIATREYLRYGSTTVAGSVINDDRLPSSKGLGLQRPQCTFEPARSIVNGHDDRNPNRA
jgi:hypothetical protein